MVKIRKIQKFWKPEKSGNPEKPEKITGQMSGKTLNSIYDELGWCKTHTKQNREDFEKSWGKKKKENSRSCFRNLKKQIRRNFFLSNFNIQIYFYSFGKSFFPFFLRSFWKQRSQIWIMLCAFRKIAWWICIYFWKGESK